MLTAVSTTGAGLGTLVLAEALPQAKILAVEPSTGLRAVLLSKLAVDTDLIRRVTVLDTDVQETLAVVEQVTVVVAGLGSVVLAVVLRAGVSAGMFFPMARVGGDLVGGGVVVGR